MKTAIYVRISPTYRDKEETITGMAKSIGSALDICRRKARGEIDMKNKGMTWAKISDYVNVSVPTIQRRLKDAGYTFERGHVIKA